MNRAFTIIEVIIAIFVLTVGVLGAARLIGYFVGYTSVSESKLTAAYLTQEGIEIVKNIRDGNYLEGKTKAEGQWNEGFATNTEYEADYKSTNTLSLFQNGYLAINNDGFYSSTDTPAVFTRKIQATSTATTTYITVTVDWQEEGRAYQVRADEKIYSWPWQ